MPTTSRSSLVVTALLLVLMASCARESGSDAPLANPTPDALAERAPDTVRVRFETSKGSFVVEAYRAWAPNGVDRFTQLARMGFYDGGRFYRVIAGFMAQFGLNGDPAVSAAWKERSIPDDRIMHPNERG